MRAGGPPLLRGVYVRFGASIDAGVNARVHAFTRVLLDDVPVGVTDVVPAYASVYVEFDARLVSGEAVGAALERVALRAERWEGDARQRELVEIPVRYDGEDLAEVAAACGLEPAEVARRHAAPEYRVYALGFTPGFPFLGEVDPAIRRPRRATPRRMVPAHAVATAGAQSGVYPLASPGGWNLLGTALVAVFDPGRERPFLLEPGDRVRFRPAAGAVPTAPGALELLPDVPELPALLVREPGLLDLVMDDGRGFGGRFGMPRSGPLDARSAALANRLVGNDARAVLLELNVRGPVLEAAHAATLAFVGWGMEPLRNGEPVGTNVSFSVRAGDVLSFRPLPEGARGYLAVAGGFEAREFMGSRSTYARGLVGRALRAGDVLGVRERRLARAGFGFRPYVRNGAVVRVRVLPGPQASREALEALASAPFTVASGDRMGVRLEGPCVPGGDVLSEATPLGAVQVPSSGQPLVLLAERGTLGGYAKPAVVHPSDLPRVGQLRSGDRVLFVLAD